MATYSKEFNGITYSNLITGKTIWTVPQDGYGNNRIYGSQTLFDEDPINVHLYLNAIEIDWNGAELPDADIQTGNKVTLNSTSDLLKLINEMQKEIYVLSAAVIAIGTGNQ